MKIKPSNSIPFLRGAVLASLVGATLANSVAHATPPATVWNGPTINFTHSAATGELQDQLTPGVAITRGNGGGLYNSVTESGPVGGVSPADTQWAVGSLANFSTLTYGACPLEAGNFPPGRVGTTFVVHLINENIFLSLKLTAWGGEGGAGDKSFSYTRSTPAAVAPTPTITITSPASGAVFAAPASVSIAATAAVSSGTVTNVQFFTNGIALKSVQTAPFTVTANNLAAGSYALMAVATAAGISATSTVVNITVAPAPTVTITSPAGGAVFAAPANVNIAATAAVSSGTVTNVQFFTNGISLASVRTAPFTATANNLGAGPCAIMAVATAAGISTTSAVVNVSVVVPVTVNLSNSQLAVSNGHFTFDYSVTPGLPYVVQGSSDLVNWVPLATNIPTATPASFSDTNSPAGAKFYRVGQLPNP